MKKPYSLTFLTASTLSLLLVGSLITARAQEPSAAQRVAILKTTMANSQASLKTYEWIETTVISLKGEEKSRKQERCYYGADGGLQKVEVSASPEPEKKRGLRGRIAERKKEELTDYMKSAVALMKTYVPPNSAQIQKAKDVGNFSVDMIDPGKRARLVFKNYEKNGDSLGVEVNLTDNLPLAMTVSSYLDKPSDAIAMNVKMDKLNDGTVYASEIVLDAPTKDLKVTIDNTGYRKSN